MGKERNNHPYEDTDNLLRCRDFARYEHQLMPNDRCFKMQEKMKSLERNQKPWKPKSVMRLLSVFAWTIPRVHISKIER